MNSTFSSRTQHGNGWLIRPVGSIDPCGAIFRLIDGSYTAVPFKTERPGSFADPYQAQIWIEQEQGLRPLKAVTR